MKKIFVFIIAALIICILYTNIRTDFYSQNPQYTPEIEMSYIVSGGTLQGNIIFYGNKIKVETIQGLNSRMVKISKFEQIILYDYIKNVLDLYNHDERSLSKTGYGFTIHTRNNIGKNGSIYNSLSGDFKSNLFVFIVLTMVYFRSVLLILLAAYFAIITLLIRIKNQVFNSKLYILFMIYSILLILIIDKALKNQHIYSLLTKQNIFQVTRYTNPVIGIIVVAFDTLIILLLKKDLKIGISYFIPSIILIPLHSLFFDGSVYTSVSGKLCDFIVFYETFPFYPKFFYFTTFMLLGICIYFIFSFISEKNYYSNIFRSIIFSVSNALLFCMTSYLTIYMTKFV